jgi:uncharacterized protein (DUF1501 family)
LDVPSRRTAAAARTTATATPCSIYGDWPGLDEDQRHEGRDLAITTDFRDVFGEVVMRHLGADESAAAQVFPRFGVHPARFRQLFG